MLILEQYYLGCLSQASYLVGDSESGVGAVVDPRRDVEEYLREAERLDLTIRHILLTHLHADFLSGHLELAEATGADIYLGARAQTDYPRVPMRQGEGLDLGRVHLKFLETPGHTPESTCILVYPEASADKPHAVLTGDTLFIGSVGRPDLLVSVGCTAEELAGQLYDSLHHKLLLLPDETLVYPGHGAGSACGKGLSNETVSTIGAQRATNAMLAIASKEAFVKEVTADQPTQPQYFAFDAAQNRKRRPVLEELLQNLKPLSPEEAISRQEDGAVLLDVREGDAFADGYLQGSLGIGLSGRFASWAGTVVSPDAPVVIIAPPGQEREAAVRLARIGYDRVEGYLKGGFEAAAARFPRRVRTFSRVSPDGIDHGAHVVDIRSPGEWEAGHIGDTPNIPLEHLTGRIAEIPRNKPVVLVCQSGYRSIIGTSLLAMNGYESVTDLRGGFMAWAARAGGR